MIIIIFRIHVTLAEDINVRCGRDGGLQNMEIQGILKLRISDPEFGFIKVQVKFMFCVIKCS